MGNKLVPDKRDIEDFLEKARIIQPETVYTEKTAPAARSKDLPVKSALLNPVNRMAYRGGRNTIEPSRNLSYRILRNVAEKAWIINLIISHQIDGVRPFLRPSRDNARRGFRVVKKDGGKMTAEEATLAGQYENFFLHTGFDDDPEREDDLDDFVAKLIRDRGTLDQVATEVQKTRTNRPCAFWAVDPATVYKVSEAGYCGNDAVKYIQEIDNTVTALYSADDLIFDYQNPRSDINHCGYGYSVVEQAIDLVTGMINAFAYNTGFFTEDRLPRGMLLLQGDADFEEVEMIEDYLVSAMSGNPANKWHIPIVPSGGNNSGTDGRRFEWVSMQGSNKDMEYGEWTDRLWSGVAGLFGVDLEELGIKTSRSAPVLAENIAPKLEGSRSRWLNSLLSFIEGHLNRIQKMVDDRFVFEFVGYERDDPTIKNQIITAEVGTYKSVDEIRAEQGLAPFGEPWSRVVLNPHVVQLKELEASGASAAASSSGAAASSSGAGTAGATGNAGGIEKSLGDVAFEV